MIDPLDSFFDVYLAYHSSDRDAVLDIARRLKAVGTRVWFDVWQIPPGRLFQDELASGLKMARSCAVFVGHSAPTGWHKQEMQKALVLQSTNPQFNVIPVILPGGDKHSVSDFLQLRTYVEFKTQPFDEEAFHRLLSGIRSLPPGEYPRRPNEEEEFINKIERLLKIIQIMKEKSLIDDVIAQEGQRDIQGRLIEATLGSGALRGPL